MVELNEAVKPIFTIINTMEVKVGPVSTLTDYLISLTMGWPGRTCQVNRYEWESNAITYVAIEVHYEDNYHTAPL